MGARGGAKGDGAIERVPEVLSVEDNAGDARLIAEIVKLANGSCALYFVRDGTEALDYLNARGRYAGAARPDLVLLDLNLPGLDGREVLKTNKDAPELRYLPVIILSSSDDERDIASAYELRASCYIVKPLDIESFDRVVTQLHSFWLSTVRLPRAA